MDQLKHRSPLLSTLPITNLSPSQRLWHRVKHFCTFILRLLWVGFAVGVGASIVYVLIPPLVRYYIHDEIYLPLKGMLHYAIFPYGWVLWFTLALVAMIIILPWVLRASLLQMIQVAVLRFAIRFKLFRWILLTVAWLSCLIRLKPERLLTVVEHAFDKQFIALGESALVSESQKSCNYFVALLEMKLTLECMVRVCSKITWNRVEQVYHSFVLLQAYGESDGAWKLRLLKRLQKRLQKIAPSNNTLESEDIFSFGRILQEIQNLMRVTCDHLSELEQKQDDASPDKSATKHVIEAQHDVNILIHNVENRYTGLLNALQVIQDEIISEEVTQRRLALIPAIKESTKDLPILGFFLLDMALHMSVLVDDPIIIRRYVDATDDLFFTGQLCQTDQSEINRILGLVQLNTSIPSDIYPLIHYQQIQSTLANLLHRNLNSYHKQISVYFTEKEKTELKANFDFERDLIDFRL